MARSKAFLSPFLVAMAIFSSIGSEAKREFVVGGRESSWQVPSSPSQLNQWAQSNRFKVGDFLIFKYDKNADSVLQATEGDYASCSTAKPLKEYKDGDTKLKLERSGPYYFISGAEGHCQKGQKLEVVVMSEKHWSKGVTATPTEAPAPAMEAPSPAPRASTAGLRDGFWIVLVRLGSLIVGLLMA
ncbi:early nodulin-like protein 3 [Rhodamnia argentea]|uniref:Early nodulin-like protein 3 n=1 Tax=Rhodamnia argentea TaxID=178133 RepID=A0A8B8NB56_9MYRT|nr:early nodulin-like protein 3 [Rhodamnia argentea]